MANAVYNSFKAKIGSINWENNSGTDIKVMLVDSTYVPDIDTHVNVGHVTGEVTGAGYTAGGQPLVNRTVVSDFTNDFARYDADDVVWTASTITARGAVIYKDTGVTSTSHLIVYIDFITEKVSSIGNMEIEWHPDGVFRIT